MVLENTLEMQQVTVEYFLQCKVLNFHDVTVLEQRCCFFNISSEALN